MTGRPRPSSVPPEGVVQMDPQAFSRRIVLPGLLLIAVGVPLYFSPLFYEYQIPKTVIFQTITVLMAAAWVSAMALNGEIRIIDTRFYYPVMAFLAASFISLFQAYNLFQGLETLFGYTCHFLVAILVFHLIRRERDLHLIAGTMIGTAGIVAVIGLLQHNDVIAFYARFGIPISTIGNVVFIAEYFNVVLPIAVVGFLGWRRPWVRAICGASCFFIICHEVVMGSRGGWLGTIVAVGVIGLAWLFRALRVGRRAMDVSVAALVIVVLSWPVVGGLLSGIPAGPDRDLGGLTSEYWRSMSERSRDALEIRDDSSQQRVLLWEDTLRLIFDRPFVGVGVGNFEYNIPQYSSRQSLEVKRRMEQRTGLELMAYRAHNDYLEIWAESGVLGILAFGAIVAQLVGAIWGLLRRFLRREADLFAVGLAASVAATLVHSFFSTNLQDPVSASHFWIVVGMVWALKLGAEGESRITVLITGAGKGPLIAVSACGLVFVGVVALGAQSLLGAYHYHLGTLRFRQKAFGQASAEFGRAAQYRFKDEFAAYQALGVSHYNLQRWPEAAQAFRSSLILHRNNAKVHYYLGVCLANLGEPSASVERLRRAVELDPLSGEYLAELGKALGLSGDAQEAVAVLQAALRITPNDAAALHSLGQNHKRLGQLDEAVDAYVQAASIKPGDGAIQNSLAVAYVEQGADASAREVLLRLIESHPEVVSYRVNLTVALLNLKRYQEALVACGELVRLEPGNARGYVLLGTVHREAGDRVQARQAYERALQLNPGDRNVLSELRRLDGGP